ncbi:FAD-binding oxidoreductase [Antrihabitans sp. YC3-6]|uniref:FAD-binding oxidoreductase n=1 Tax=Antrihabitans stalagmiti TaxID=2799499 RepID=A0A934U3S0_9NOCA|nr:FAD-binding protein [Antrihabitans stalagmiti]MBJ8339138.1 FAD-binding oxidoreductase [Antrihabitans stalagmiti]
MTPFESLAAAVEGRVTTKADATATHRDWTEITRPWNLQVSQEDAVAVVDVDSITDVQQTVEFAAAHDLSVSTQRTGHGAAGNAAGTILLRTNNLNTLEIDATSRRAHVGAGVLWGQVQGSAAAHGLSGTPGSSPGVGVVGFTVGGGLSWFSRKFGLAGASARSFTVVTADGERLYVDNENEPDLYWALRGGGGDVAIVTSVELQLQPAPSLFGGRMMWPADRARDVMLAYKAVTADAPDDLTLWLDLLHFPGSPTPLVALDCTFLGAETLARELLSPFDSIGGPLSDTRATMSPADLASITGDPLDPSPGISHAVPVRIFDEDVIAALLREPIFPLLSVQVRHLGGALRAGQQTPNGPTTSEHLVYLFGSPTPDRPVSLIRDRLAALADDLAPYTGHGKPLTFLAPGETMSAALPDQSVRKLATLKHRWDPNRILRSNYPTPAVDDLVGAEVTVH